MRRRWTLVAVILAVAVFSSGCLAELEEFFTILAYAESDDPELRRIAAKRDDWRREDQANEAIDHWITTGDRSAIDEAIRLRPDDSQMRAYALIQARRDGDPEAIAAAENALAYAKARELDTNDAARIQSSILGNMLVAQTMALSGGTYDGPPWDPPGPDAPPSQQALFEDYCETLGAIQSEPGRDPANYMYVAPCP